MSRHVKTVQEGGYDGYRMFMRNERIRCGYRQSDLAKLVHISRVTLTQYENGTREPDYGTIKKIKKHLCVDSVDKLYEQYVYKDGIFVGEDGSEELGIA